MMQVKEVGAVIGLNESVYGHSGTVCIETPDSGSPAAGQ